MCAPEGGGLSSSLKRTDKSWQLRTPQYFAIASGKLYDATRNVSADLLLGHHNSDYFHVLFAADLEANNVRVVTAYRPDREKWEKDLKTRRSAR